MWRGFHIPYDNGHPSIMAKLPGPDGGRYRGVPLYYVVDIHCQNYYLPTATILLVVPLLTVPMHVSFCMRVVSLLYSTSMLVSGSVDWTMLERTYMYMCTTQASTRSGWWWCGFISQDVYTVSVCTYKEVPATSCFYRICDSTIPFHHSIVSVQWL